MRERLKASEGVRARFVALFSKVGKKRNYKGYSEDTILLSQVKDADTGELVADHVWFTFTKGFEAVNARPGDLLQFEARIKEYKKGYVNKAAGINQRRTDYKLSHPGKIQKINSHI